MESWKPDKNNIVHKIIMESDHIIIAYFHDNNSIFGKDKNLELVKKDTISATMNQLTSHQTKQWHDYLIRNGWDATPVGTNATRYKQNINAIQDKPQILQLDKSHYQFSYQGEYSKLLSISFSPSGRYLIAGISNPKHCIVWDIETSEIIWKLDSENNVNFVSDDHILVSNGYIVELRNTESNKTLRQFLHKSEVNALTVSPNALLFISETSDDISVWEISTGKKLYHHHKLHENKSFTQCKLFFNYENQLFFLYSEKGILYLQEFVTNRVVLKIKNDSYFSIPQTDISYDGNILAVGNSSQGSVELIDIKTGLQLHKLTLFGRYITCLSFSPDGKLLATSAGGVDRVDDRSVQLWELSSGKKLWENSGYYPKNGVNALAFSPDKRFFTWHNNFSTNINVYSIKWV